MAFPWTGCASRAGVAGSRSDVASLDAAERFAPVAAPSEPGAPPLPAVRDTARRDGRGAATTSAEARAPAKATPGGVTSEGRLTLFEFVRRLRHGGGLNAQGINERDHFEVLEQLVERLTGGDAPVKLHFITDRRALLDRAKEVYARAS